MRGRTMWPKPLSAEANATRIQQVEIRGRVGPVPVELHFHPAILVGVDRLAVRSDHGSRLGTAGHRPGRDARRAPGRVSRRRQDLDHHRLLRRAVAARHITLRIHPIGHAGDQVFLVEPIQRVLVQFQDLPAGQLDGVADAAVMTPLGLLRQHRRLGQGRVAVVVGEVGVVVVDLGLVGRRRGARRRLSGVRDAPLVLGRLGRSVERRRLQRVVALHLGLRLGEVEVAERRLALGPGHDGLGPAPDPVIHPGLLRRSVLHIVVAAVGMRSAIVAQHHDVAAVAMVEEVVDALLLHQPRDEGEVALAVLHAIVALGVGALLQLAEIDVLAMALVEHRLDDLHRRLLLEDDGIRGCG